MKPIRLPIFYDTSDFDREELGLPPLSYDQCEVRDVVFLNIDVIEPTKDGGSIIYSGLECWSTPLSPNEVYELWKK